MDVFSLEDEDYSQMFFTQSSPKRVDLVDSSPILGDGNDFASPLVLLVPKRNEELPEYSDISDDDFMDLPSSQVVQNSPASSGRYVFIVVSMDL